MKKPIALSALFFFASTLCFVPGVCAANASYQKATELYNAIEYKQAAPLFEQAIVEGGLSASENVKARECLAEIYVGLGSTLQAVEQYRQLLLNDRNYKPGPEASPPMMDAFKEAKSKLPPPAVAKKEEPKKEKPKKQSNWRKALGWTLIGGGIGMAAVGGAMFGMAYSEHDKFVNAASAGAANSARDMGRTDEAVGWTLGGLGLVSIGVGAYFVVEGNKQTPRAAVYGGYMAQNGLHAATMAIVW